LVTWSYAWPVPSVYYQLGRKKCKAFPRGIPTKIYAGDFDHNMEFEGDKGIRYVDLEIPTRKEDQRERAFKLVRIDFDAGEGVIEHYSLINSETRETMNYLVLSLSEKLRDKRNGS